MGLVDHREDLAAADVEGGASNLLEASGPREGLGGQDPSPTLARLDHTSAWPELSAQAGLEGALDDFHSPLE